MKESIFKKKEDKSTQKNEHAALMTVIGPKNLLILLGIGIFLISVIIFSITVPINITTVMGSTVSYGEGTVNVTAENEGILTDINVSEGDYVQKGDLLGVVTNENLWSQVANGAVLTDVEQSKIKRQTMIVAMDSGVIKGLNYQEGEYLPKNSTFCQIIKRENINTAVVILTESSYAAAQNVKQGDLVFIALESAPSNQYGYLRGVVRNVKANGASQDGGNNRAMAIIIDPKVDAQGNYMWTKENNGFNGEISEGTSCIATIFTDKLYLINLIIP
ncbi:MAG: biotin/lipoyl-binding protein [Eubacteriaceae bacterium]|nr:biotin/lipoyl-binding protein [Eubacteriaceae bacterium]